MISLGAALGAPTANVGMLLKRNFAMEDALFFKGAGDGETSRLNAVAAERLSESVGVASGVKGNCVFVPSFVILVGVK